MTKISISALLFSVIAAFPGTASAFQSLQDRCARKTHDLALQNMISNPNRPPETFVAVVIEVTDGDTVGLEPLEADPVPNFALATREHEFLGSEEEYVGPIAVRLSEIDAPELHQPGGPESKGFLINLLWSCRPKNDPAQEKCAGRTQRWTDYVDPKNEKDVRESQWFDGTEGEANPLVYVRALKKDRYDRVLAEIFLPSGERLENLILAAGQAWQYKAYSKSKTLQGLEQTARKARLGLWGDANPTAPWQYRKRR